MNETLEICKSCNGRGWWHYEKTHDLFQTCLQCYGSGKIFWIDCIFGRNKEREISILSTHILNKKEIVLYRHLHDVD